MAIISDPVLHGYFRSTATYRVRIALNLKGVSYTDTFHDLRAGEQRSADYLALNPQGLIPALEIDGAVLTQSLAICEYLDETVAGFRLLPDDPLRRAQIRAAAQVIACDTHPVQNLKILQRLRGLGLAEAQVTQWARQAIDEGLDAFDRLIAQQDGRYCFGDRVTLADIFLVPQLFNARRFGVDLRWPRLMAVEKVCQAMDAFRRAAPEHQADA